MIYNYNLPRTFPLHRQSACHSNKLVMPWCRYFSKTVCGRPQADKLKRSSSAVFGWDEQEFWLTLSLIISGKFNHNITFYNIITDWHDLIWRLFSMGSQPYLEHFRRQIWEQCTTRSFLVKNTLSQGSLTTFIIIIFVCCACQSDNS